MVSGLAILTCFTAEHPVLGAPTHRNATTLLTLGYLEQGPSRKYRLASLVSDVGFSLLDSMKIRRVAREPLSELRAPTGRTASLAVPWGTEPGSTDGVDRGRGIRAAAR